MLLELFRWLSSDIPGFNVFNYISLRAVLSVITSLLISFCFGGWFIKKLGEDKLWFETKEALLSKLFNIMKPKSTVLVKGSRFMRMEEIVHKIIL